MNIPNLKKKSRMMLELFEVTFSLLWLSFILSVMIWRKWKEWEYINERDELQEQLERIERHLRRIGLSAVACVDPLNNLKHSMARVASSFGDLKENVSNR